MVFSFQNFLGRFVCFKVQTGKVLKCTEDIREWTARLQFKLSDGKPALWGRCYYPMVGTVRKGRADAWNIFLKSAVPKEECVYLKESAS